MDSIKIILVEDKQDDVILFEKYVDEVNHNEGKKQKLNIVKFPLVSDALIYFMAKSADVIISDLNLSDCTQDDTINLLKKYAGKIPFIILTNIDDEEVGIKAIKQGAQDYIVKESLNSQILYRAVKYAIERHKKERLLESKNLEIEEMNEKLLYSNNLLIKSQEELKKTNNTKDRFFSIIAHDLRGPFGSLITSLELINDKEEALDKESQEDLLFKLEKLVKTTHAMLENLLKWAMVQTGDLSFKPDKVKVGELIYNSIKHQEEIAGGKNILMKYDIEAGLNTFCDSNMIATVLRNLVGNALKFTKENGEVIVSAKSNENRVEISIKDDGIGISQENLKKIFKLEEKVKQIGTKGEKGSGLGLLLCKEFIEKNKGNIWIDSELGKGSTFTFTLPKFD